MKFSVTSSNLNQALSAVIGAVPTKATLPILETVLFETENGRLKLTATNLELSIIEYLDADIEVEGRVAIPARRLLETLRQLPEIPVRFEVDDRQNIRFRTDRGSYKLVGEEAAEFPETPALSDGTLLKTSCDLLRDAIQKTNFAVSNDDLRPAMMGVYFVIGKEKSTFVATDGHRLVRYMNRGLVSEEELGFIVPENSLSQVQKVLDEESECEITVTQGHARFQSGNTIILTRLINEPYPNYESVIPHDNDRELIISKEQMLAAVRRVSVFSSTTARQIRLELENDRLTIRAEDLDMSSEAKEEIRCDYSGEPMEIGFNARYLADVLNNIDGDEVRFLFSTPNRAGIVRPAGEDEERELLMLVMPVMLNTHV